MHEYLVQFEAEMMRVLPTRSCREKNAFSLLSLDEKAWRFMNWQSRLIHPHVRQVNKAVGFETSHAVQNRWSEVVSLLAHIACGQNVTAHLSDGILQGYCVHTHGVKGGPDFDLLLNEWGIHHLHLDFTPGRGGFRKRSEDVLYGIFGRGVAFILAVAPHRHWTSKRFIEIAVQSWPEQGLFLALGIPPGRDYTESEHKALRKVGMTTAAVVDNRHWISGVTCGMTTALVSARVVRETGHLTMCIHQAISEPHFIVDKLKENAAANNVFWPNRPVISVRWLSGPDRYCFGFVEEVTQAVVYI